MFTFAFHAPLLAPELPSPAFHFHSLRRKLQSSCKCLCWSIVNCFSPSSDECRRCCENRLYCVLATGQWAIPNHSGAWCVVPLLSSTRPGKPKVAINLRVHLTKIIYYYYCQHNFRPGMTVKWIYEDLVVVVAPWTTTGGAVARGVAPPKIHPVSPTQLIILYYLIRITFLPFQTSTGDTRHAPLYDGCCQRDVGAHRGDANRECS